MNEVEDKSSFKKKRKFVYLDKYEIQMEELRNDISYLKRTLTIINIALALLTVGVALRELNII